MSEGNNREGGGGNLPLLSVDSATSPAATSVKNSVLRASSSAVGVKRMAVQQSKHKISAKKIKKLKPPKSKPAISNVMLYLKN